LFTKILLIGTLTSSLLLAQNSLPKDATSIGIELNPLTILAIGDDSKDTAFSGAISLFDNINASEIALSVAYEKEYSDLFGINGSSIVAEVMDVSLHYRKFARAKTNGFYYGGFTAYTYLDGQLKNDTRLATVEKFGIGAEIGFRLMKTESDWSVYWGPSFKIGRYFGSDNNVFESNSLGMLLYDKDLFIDIDFFRVGFRF